MQIKSQQVVGLKLLTLDDGKFVDNVKDVIYDPQQNKVVALMIDAGGWFKDAKVVLFHDIKAIGKDAITIESADVMKKAGDVQDHVANIARDDQYLTKTKVVTEDGTELGSISDIGFDSLTGNVVEFEVTQGAIRDIQSGRKTFSVHDIVTVGAEATVVKASTAKEFEQQSQEQGLQGAIKQGMEKSREWLNNAGDKVSAGAEMARDKIEEGAAAARDKTQEMVNDPQLQSTALQAKLQAGAAAERIRQGFEDVKSKISAEVNDPENQEKISKVKDEAKKVKDQLVEGAQSVANDMQNKAHELSNATKDKDANIKVDVDLRST